MITNDELTRDTEDYLDSLEEFGLTDEEKKRVAALESKYDVLISETVKRMAELRNGEEAPEWRPDYASRAELQEMVQKLIEWENAGSDEWKAENERRINLYEELNDERAALITSFNIERFSRLNGDVNAIIEDARQKVTNLIENEYYSAATLKATQASFRRDILRVDNEDIYLDPERTIERCRDLLFLHYSFFEGNSEQLDLLEKTVHDTVYSNPHVQEKGELFGLVNKGRRNYRTTAKAVEGGAVSDVPRYLATLSLKGYEKALGLADGNIGKSNAFIEVLKPGSLDKLKYEDGVLSVDGYSEISEAEIINFQSKEVPETLDMPLLTLYYSIILQEYETNRSFTPGSVKTVKVPVQKLADAMGMKGHLSGPDIERLIERTSSFHDLIGVLKDANGRSAPSRYPVLTFQGYNREDNTISFSGPYLSHLVGKAIAYSQSKTLRHDVHTYLIKTTAVKASNDARAYEIVTAVVQGITQVGEKKTYHIKASTLVDRCELLKAALQRDPKHKTQTLKRVFTKAWKMLREDTTLASSRILPDPDNIKDIPTASDLNIHVFEFPPKE